jgi:hypothetical protein
MSRRVLYLPRTFFLLRPRCAGRPGPELGYPRHMGRMSYIQLPQVLATVVALYNAAGLTSPALYVKEVG